MKQQLSNCNAETITSSHLRTRTNLLSSLLFLLFIGITQVGCDDSDDCALIDCLGPFAYIELNIQQEGQDIVFGPTPLVAPEDIQIISGEEDNTNFVITDDTILLGIINSDTISIEIGNLQTVTIQVETEDRSTTECCLKFEITRIEMDGETLCETECAALDIEIE